MAHNTAKKNKKGGLKSRAKFKKTKKTKKEKNISFKKLNCNPATNKNKNKTQNNTCYNNTQLQFIRSLWNAKHSTELISKSASSAQIWTIMKKKYNNQCQDEACWVDKLKPSQNNGSKLKNAFSPAAPKEWIEEPNSWLSDTDIKLVLKQYEDAYKCFDFIGPSPIDFDTRTKDPYAKVKTDDDCVWEELCKFSVKKCI
jgi:hypothetical protein